MDPKEGKASAGDRRKRRGMAQRSDCTPGPARGARPPGPTRMSAGGGGGAERENEHNPAGHGLAPMGLIMLGVAAVARAAASVRDQLPQLDGRGREVRIAEQSGVSPSFVQQQQAITRARRKR